MDATVLPKRSSLCRPNDSTSKPTLLFPFQACPLGPAENAAYRGSDTFPRSTAGFRAAERSHARGSSASRGTVSPLPLLCPGTTTTTTTPSPVQPTQLCTLLLSLTFLHWLAGKSIRGGRGIKQEAKEAGGMQGLREDKKGGGTFKREKRGE